MHKTSRRLNWINRTKWYEINLSNKKPNQNRTKKNKKITTTEQNKTKTPQTNKHTGQELKCINCVFSMLLTCKCARKKSRTKKITIHYYIYIWFSVVTSFFSISPSLKCLVSLKQWTNNAQRWTTTYRRKWNAETKKIKEIRIMHRKNRNKHTLHTLV